MDDRRRAVARWIRAASRSTAVRLAVSVGLVGVLVWQIGPASLLDRVLRLPAGVFAVAVGLSVANVCLSVWKWMILLRAAGYARPYGVLWVYYYVGQFFNFFFPSAIGGDSVRAYYLYADLGEGYDALSSIVAERATGLVAIALVAGPAAVLAGSALPPAVRVAVLAFGVGTVVLATTYMTGGIEWLLDRTLAAVGAFDVGTRTMAAYDALATYRSAPLPLAYALALSIAFRFVLVANTYVVAAGLGVDVPAVYYLLFVPVVELLLFLPVSIQGFGVREASYAYLFTAVGADPAGAVALGVVMSVVLGVVNNLLGGGVYLLDRAGLVGG